MLFLEPGHEICRRTSSCIVFSPATQHLWGSGCTWW
jgi:hypothetical protein